MKKLIALICIFVLSISCTQEPDGPRVRLELVPVETVVLPTTFTANTVNEIEVTYSRPSSCHGFEGFYYTKDAVTTVDYDFMAKIKHKASQYIIYADNCLLEKDFMLKHHIIFKKIPRDITRF